MSDPPYDATTGSDDAPAQLDVPTLVPAVFPESRSGVAVVSCDADFVARCVRVLRAEDRLVDVAESVAAIGGVAPSLIVLDVARQELEQSFLLLALTGSRAALVLVLRSVDDLATAESLGIACVDANAADDVLLDVVDHAYCSPRLWRVR